MEQNKPESEKQPNNVGVSNPNTFEKENKTENVENQLNKPSAPKSAPESVITKATKSDNEILKEMVFKLQEEHSSLKKEIEILKGEKQKDYSVDNTEKKEQRKIKIQKLASTLFEKTKGTNTTWVTLVDENKNYWNSSDHLHFYLNQGRCKELPEELSGVLAHALSPDNKLLREANEEEVKKELRIRAKEQLISFGEIPADNLSETPLKL